MITTITFNPSIDRMYRVDEINIGEVQRVKSINATAGGKGTVQIQAALVDPSGWHWSHCRSCHPGTAPAQPRRGKDRAKLCTQPTK